MTHLFAEERVQHPTLAAGNGGHVDLKAAPDLPREGHLQEKGRQPSVAAVVSRRDRAAGKKKKNPARPPVTRVVLCQKQGQWRNTREGEVGEGEMRETERDREMREDGSRELAVCRYGLVVVAVYSLLCCRRVYAEESCRRWTKNLRQRTQNVTTE